MSAVLRFKQRLLSVRPSLYQHTITRWYCY